jgi:hypothetical protein
MDVDVHEFAVLGDGRRLTLHRGRGFSTSAMPQLGGSVPPNASGAMAMPQHLWHRTPNIRFA